MTNRRSLNCRPMTRNAAFSGLFGAFSPCSPDRSTRWRCSSTICNGSRLGNAGPAGGFVDPAGRAASNVDRAYRDNEVISAHPLIRKLEAIRKAGAVVHEIILRLSPVKTWDG